MPRSFRASSAYRLGAVAATALATTLLGAVPARSEQVAFGDVRSWGYQLQNAHPRFGVPKGLDLLVVDYSSDGSPKCVLKPEDVALLKKRPGEPDRLVLAYMSIGEAEDYRFYWNEAWITRSIPQPPDRPYVACHTPSPEWQEYARLRNSVVIKRTGEAPPWLDEENANWRGNFLVRYWDPSWRAILYGSPQAYLDRILAAGFDGVYLDRVDAFEQWESKLVTAEQEMVDLVRAIAAYGRARKPGFVVVPQNAEGLLKHKAYVTTIDGIAKEDLLYGLDFGSGGAPNAGSETAWSRAMLDRALRAGKKVLVVEYVEQPDLVRRARKTLVDLGYIPFFSRRGLDTIPTEILATDEPDVRSSER